MAISRANVDDNSFSWNQPGFLTGESRYINGLETTNGEPMKDLMTFTKGVSNAGNTIKNTGLGTTDTIYMFLYATDQQIELSTFNRPYYSCTAAPNASTTRFAEITAMPALTFGNTKGGFISACADIANKWRIPYAGPTITGLRINNIGSSSCTIAKIGLYSNINYADEDYNNLLTSSILTNAKFYINTSFSYNVDTTKGATWANYTYASSGVGETMNATNGLLTIIFATGTVIGNAGFIKLGILSSNDIITNIRFNISFTYDYGNSWEDYDMCFCSNGSSLNTETNPVINGAGNQIAKNNIYTLWKRKWRIQTDDVNLPYYTLPYDLSRDVLGLAAFSTTGLRNITLHNIDIDRAMKRYLTKLGNMGSTLLNIVMNDKEAGNSYVSITSANTDNSTETTYNYNSLQKTYGADAAGVIAAPIVFATRSESTSGWFMDPVSGQFGFCPPYSSGNNIAFTVGIKKTITNRFYIYWNGIGTASAMNMGGIPYAGGIKSICNSLFFTTTSNNIWHEAFNNIRGTIFHWVGSIAQSNNGFGGDMTQYTWSPRFLTITNLLRLYGCTVLSNGSVVGGWGDNNNSYIEYNRLKTTSLFKTTTQNSHGPCIISIVVDTHTNNYISSFNDLKNYIQIYENGVKLDCIGLGYTFVPFYARVTNRTNTPCGFGYNLCGNFKACTTLIEDRGTYASPSSFFINNKDRFMGSTNVTSSTDGPFSYYAKTTETMDNRAFTQTEINNSITNVMNRWGIIKPFRFMRITHTAGNVNLSFSQLGLYATRDAAIADSGTAANSWNCLYNITTVYMRRPDFNSILNVGTVTTGFTTFNSSAALTFPPVDGLPTIIDLGDNYAPSYIRFSTMGTNSSTAHRLKLELSSDSKTWYEHEMRYYDSTGAIRNTRDHQFLSSFNNDANNTGVYNYLSGGAPGVFLLYNPLWDTEENIGNDSLLLSVSSMNPNNTVSSSDVITLANSSFISVTAPTVTMTANGSLTLVPNAFGSGKNAILTRWGNGNGMFSTSTTLTLGGSADGTGVEFTIYFLGRGATTNNASEVGLFCFGLPTATSRNVNYQAEFTRKQMDTIGSIITPGAQTYVIGGNETNWLGVIGNRDASTYPTDATSFEVWCITKAPGVNGVEVYLNNNLLTITSQPSWSTNATTWAKRASGYWQLGDGATSSDRGDPATSTGTYIGAFQVYNKYHTYSNRCGILRSLMDTFYIQPTARTNGITATTLSSITQFTRTTSFTITIADYPHRNVQSLEDFYVFFARSNEIPTSISIIENNVTAINTSIPGVITLTCTALCNMPDTVVLCLAIAKPGAAKTTSTNVILTYNSTFNSTKVSNTFQIEFWFAPAAVSGSSSTINTNFSNLLIRTAASGSNTWSTIYDYDKAGQGGWMDQENNLVTNDLSSAQIISTVNFCSTYNTYKFTTPEMYVKKAVVIQMFYLASLTWIIAPCFTDGIRIKYNGVLYTTLSSATAAGIQIHWVTCDTTSTNLNQYLTKTDSTTDMTSPITVNSNSFKIVSLNSNYFVDASPKVADQNQFAFGNGTLPGNGVLQYGSRTFVSCLRIIFPD
jgi:hypothetical protein